jgi:hypothetical protein
VELIGDFQVLRGDGLWAPPPDVRQRRQVVRLDDLRLPVMPLAYRLLGKTHRAAVIDHWLAKHAA